MDLTKKIIARIDFKNQGARTIDVDITMPVWVIKDPSGKFVITLGLMGNIKTFADSESEVKDAITETLQALFNNFDLHGRGINEELTSLGWQSKKNSIRFRVGSSKESGILAALASAGNMKSISLKVAA